MAFEIVWTEPGSETFRAVVDNIRNENPAAAERFAADVLRRVDDAARFPHAGNLYARRRGMEIREVYHGVYRIFYRVRTRLQRIEVLLIWHGSRREPKLKRR